MSLVDCFDLIFGCFAIVWINYIFLVMFGKRFTSIAFEIVIESNVSNVWTQIELNAFERKKIECLRVSAKGFDFCVDSNDSVNCCSLNCESNGVELRQTKAMEAMGRQ